MRTGKIKKLKLSHPIRKQDYSWTKTTSEMQQDLQNISNNIYVYTISNFLDQIHQFDLPIRKIINKLIK